MCTAIHFGGNPHFLARTLDYEIGYGEGVLVTPRRCPICRGIPHPMTQHYAIIGMGIEVEQTPLYFDAFNEAGLCGAALLFPKENLYRRTESPRAIASFALLSWVLGQCRTLCEAEALLSGLIISDETFSAELPPTPLHWIFADATRAIVIESTADGVSVISTSVGVLTNAPAYPHQLATLEGFSALSPYPQQPNDRGSGARGLPGDWTSASRFVRAAFVRQYAEFPRTPESVFTLASAVAVPPGCVRLPDGRSAHTRYIACHAPAAGIYYHTRAIGAPVYADALRDFALDENHCQRGLTCAEA